MFLKRTEVEQSALCIFSSLVLTPCDKSPLVAAGFLFLCFSAVPPCKEEGRDASVRLGPPARAAPGPVAAGVRSDSAARWRRAVAWGPGTLQAVKIITNCKHW